MVESLDFLLPIVERKCIEYNPFWSTSWGYQSGVIMGMILLHDQNKSKSTIGFK